MKNLWTKRNITKFFEIINTKLSSSKKKKKQVDVEEEYNFYADDDEKIVAIQLKWVSNRLEIEKYHHDLYSAYRLPQSEWFKLSKSPNI